MRDAFVIRWFQFRNALSEEWSYPLRTNSRFMENDMKHALKNSITENMHGLLECIFVDYANQLRANYPGRIIRNAAVFASGVPEFARLSFIELVDARSGMPEG